MENSKVIQFNKNDEFYFNLGKDYLQNGDILKAIQYIHKAINLAKTRDEFLISSYYLVLAQAYAMANNFELSNYYYFLCLDSEIFAQLVYRGLGENFLQQKDLVSARYYLNKCVNLLENTQLSDNAKKRLKLIEDINNKGFQIVGKNTDFNKSKKLQNAEQLMSKGKFEQAIKIFEEVGDFSDPKVRAELSLAYFFMNDTKKGIELINNFGEETVLDLCNLLLIYYCEEEKEKFNKIKDKLRSIDVKRAEDNFKIGLTFAQTEELELGKLYMEKFLATSKYETELEFLYCLTCINCKDYESAKKKLIELKTLNPFSSYVFNYYLDICDKKIDKKIEYLFNIPISEYLKVQTKLKTFLVLEDYQLKKEFLKDKDLFYFIAKLPETNTKNLLLIKMAKLDGKEIKAFFSYVLMGNDVSSKTKNKIIIARLNVESINKISFVKDNFYTKITLSNKKAMKISNENVNKATLLSVEYLINETNIADIYLRNISIYLQRKLGNEIQDENVIACYITWKVTREGKLKSLNEICSYFNISQNILYEFAQKNNLTMD